MKKGTFTDPRDGKVYKTVKIGKQVWMAENLAYNAEGSKVYDNDESNCQKYGRLYDWITAMEACPDGWHLPSEEEWNTLVDFAGGEEIAGEKLKAKSGWKDYKGKSGNGTDDFGFAALPAGGSFSDDVNFSGIGIDTVWHSSSKYNAYYTRKQDSYCGNMLKLLKSELKLELDELELDESDLDDPEFWSGIWSGLLFSVRCVQDN